MSSAYTTLLGLVQPTTGELNGAWGATVNAQLTQLLEDAIAGYSTADITSTDWTLTTTGGGVANEARSAILIVTGTPTAAKNIIAPKKSKTYIVVNNTSVAVTVKGGPTSPTTGVEIAANTTGVVAWDTTALDFKAVTGGSSNGGSGAVGGGNNVPFLENEPVVTDSYTIGDSGMTTCTISIASPAVITQANDYVAGTAVRFSTTGALPSGLNTTTVYYVIATGLTPASFRVSTAVGGSAVVTTGTQSGTHSCGKLKNAVTGGPVTVLDSVSVTVPTGASWTIV